MNADAKIRATMRELGVAQYDLVWFTTSDGKPYLFKLTFRDCTFRGSCVRTIIRAVRRHFCPHSKSPAPVT